MKQLKVKPAGTILVQTQQVNSKKQKQKKPKKIPKERMYSGALRKLMNEGAYQYALNDPFNTLANGARIPDMYTGHTVCLDVKKSITLNSSSGGTGDLIIFPSMEAIAVSPRASLAGVTDAILWGDGNSAGAGSMLYGPTVQQILDTYRIVGMGVRITGIQSMTNSSGKLCVATYPIRSALALRNFPVAGATPVIDANKSGANTLAAWNTPNSGAFINQSNLIQFPGARVFGLSELSQQPIEVVPKLCDPLAQSFRHAGDDFIGFSVANGATVSGSSTNLSLDRKSVV